MLTVLRTTARMTQPEDTHSPPMHLLATLAFLRSQPAYRATTPPPNERVESDYVICRELSASNRKIQASHTPKPRANHLNSLACFMIAPGAKCYGLMHQYKPSPSD